MQFLGRSYKTRNYSLCFLPTLIFEAAFDLDVHTFKKSFWNAFLMAVPGILVAIFISASLAMGIK